MGWISSVDVSPSASSVAIGCSVAIISSAIQSLGITLQRKSHLISYHNNDSINNVPHQQRHKRNMWLTGFLLFIVANVLGSLIQITTLPLIILSPLQSIGLIFNSIMSCMLLPGESFTQKLGWGTLVIAIGAFIIAYNGNTAPIKPPEDLDPSTRFNMVLEKFLKTNFLMWFIYTFVFSALIVLVNYLLGKRSKKLMNRLQKRKSILLSKTLKRYKFIRGINYGLVSGTLTAHTFLFAKSIVDVIVEIILGNKHGLQSIFHSSNISAYLLLIMMFTIIGMQVTMFNLGLSQISTSILYPLCFLVYNVVNLINDLVFNSLISSHSMSISQLLWIIFGLIGVLFGVILISWDSSSSKDVKNLESEDLKLLNLKFPYYESSETNFPKLSTVRIREYLSSSDDSVNLINLNSNLGHTTSNSKRVLSYEEDQLLRLLNI